ncbi:hypothetical protein N9Y42_10650 [Mariniblastus sp.]|nr:hypothetical protein [Mariniblastus sp.]
MSRKPFVTDLSMKHLKFQLGPALLFIAFLNFTAFFLIAIAIGGDAISGEINDGKYYLANHGETTEVRRSVWLYSYYHAISIFVTHSLGMFAGMHAIFKQQHKHNQASG